MVELLVVILLIGILAMIALPAFLSQRAKGEDTEAKLTVRTAVAVLATFQTDHDTYDATPEELVELEPALGEARELEVTGDEDSFSITETSSSETTFTHERTATGEIERECSRHGHGGCRNTADGSGHWW